MEGHLSRSARLLDLLQALRRRRRPVAAADLAEELGVSLRTVYRDVATLMAQGAPIEGAAGLGYILKPGFFLPPLMSGADEVDALILGLRLMSQRGDAALGRAADDALAKIAAVLPPALEDAAATSGPLTGPRDRDNRPHLAIIRLAIRTEEKLRLEQRAAAAGILVSAGRHWYPAKPPAPYLRLSFAAAKPDWIEACVAQLARVIRNTLASPE